jgi:hypothetical protein
MSRQGISGQALLITGGAGHGKSALVRHVLASVREDEAAHAMVLVAQSSATLGGVMLHTAKQFLQRWRHAQLPAAAVVARVLAAAGMAGAEGDDGAGDETEEVAARKKALGALVGDGGAPVPIVQQVRGHTPLSLRTHASWSSTYRVARTPPRGMLPWCSAGGKLTGPPPRRRRRS